MMIGRKETRRLARSVRPILAGVVALLIVLQGLAAVGASFARSAHAHGEAGFVASLLGVTCAEHGHGDDKPPGAGPRSLPMLRPVRSARFRRRGASWSGAN